MMEQSYDAIKSSSLIPRLIVCPVTLVKKIHFHKENWGQLTYDGGKNYHIIIALALVPKIVCL